MKFDLKQCFVNYDNANPMRKADNSYLVLKNVIIGSLGSLQIGMKSAQKITQGTLAKRIFLANDAIDFSTEEYDLIREVIKQVQPPIICVQALDMLEIKEDKK